MGLLSDNRTVCYFIKMQELQKNEMSAGGEN